MGTKREAQQPAGNVTWHEDNGCLRTQGQVGSRSPEMPHRGNARPGQLLATGLLVSRARPGVVSRWGSVEITRSHTLCLKLPLTVAQEHSPIQPVQWGRLYGWQPTFLGGWKSQLRDECPLHPCHILHSLSREDRARAGHGKGNDACGAPGCPGGVTGPRHTAS